MSSPFSFQYHPAGRHFSAKKQRGFALLITVTLLAFLVLLLVSLASLTRVETQVAANTLIVTQARQNAMMALNIAIGRLQEKVGLDARVTADASLIDAASPNRDWVGVWNSSSSGGTTNNPTPLGWLVSGTNVTPSTDLKTDPAAIMLVNAGEANGSNPRTRAVFAVQEKIRAAGIPGLNPSDVMTIGSFAYYIADEGQKARVLSLPKREAADLSYGYYGDATSGALPRQRTLQMGGRSPAPFKDIPAFDNYSADNQLNLSKVVSTTQLGLFDAAVGPEQVRQHWHDYTSFSAAVPVDTVTGRLKGDLSHSLAATLGTGAGDYQALATSAQALSASPSYPLTDYKGADGGPGFVIAPVITQFFFQAGIHNGPGDGTLAPRINKKELEVRGRFFFELWNPYTSALSIPTDTLRVLVDGLPTVQVTATNASGTKNYGSASVDLQTIFPNDSGGVVLLLPQGSPIWRPGRIHTFTHPSGYNATPAASALKPRLTFESNFRNTYWAVVPPSAVLAGGDTPDANMTFAFTSDNPVRLRLRLQYLKAGTWTDLATYNMPEYQKIAAGTTSLPSTDRNPDFGFSYRMLERNDYLQNPADPLSSSDWLTRPEILDYRRKQYPAEMFTPFSDDDPASYTANAPQPDSSVEQKYIFNRPFVGTFPVFAPLPDPAYDFALYELPRQEQVSVSGLQQLAFTQNDGTPRRSYALGNGWSADNSWFDRYFFSTVPAETSSGVRTLSLPNVNMERVPDSVTGQISDDETVRATPAESAGSVLVRGAFNLNSTSSAAWRAVLGGLRLGSWSYVTYNTTTSAPAGSASIDISNPFFRFGQSAGETWEWDATAVPASNNVSPRRFYRRGVRSLTDAQISRLADAIVSALRQARAGKGPVSSIEEFLAPLTSGAFGGRNVLEEAIFRANETSVPIAERVNYDSTYGGLAVPIDPGSPSFLLASDIMTALAPLLTPRSDTFIIRTYGSVQDPLDSNAANAAAALPTPKAAAWLEAVVQRVAQPVLQGGPPAELQSPSATGFGRRFKIISFRWLSSNDI